MAFYQASKQLTKFIISGIIAVGVDFVVYFVLSQYMGANESKALSFCSGMLVTYNLNKYWTWRQTDKNNKRLIINVSANSFLLNSIPNYLFRFSIESEVKEVLKSYALGLDKFLAFFFATALSATSTFLGQKYWLFKQKD
jgi:putative flippase GtrA